MPFLSPNIAPYGSSVDAAIDCIITESIFVSLAGFASVSEVIDFDEEETVDGEAVEEVSLLKSNAVTQCQHMEEGACDSCKYFYRPSKSSNTASRRAKKRRDMKNWEDGSAYATGVRFFEKTPPLLRAAMKANGTFGNPHLRYN